MRFSMQPSAPGLTGLCDFLTVRVPRVALSVSVSVPPCPCQHAMCLVGCRVLCLQGSWGGRSKNPISELRETQG